MKWPWSKKKVEDRPKLARIHVHYIPCEICRAALLDNDLVVGGTTHTRLAHASCAVIILRKDGSLQKLTGEALTGKEKAYPGLSLVLTEDEWTAWIEKAEEIES